MKLKSIHLAVLATLLSSTAFSATKTIDFYSTNGNNRYSIVGNIKDLNLITEKNTVLVKEANADAYITINNKLPYYVRFLKDDLNLYQVMEANKGKIIKHNNKDVKIIGFQGENVVAEADNGIIFISMKDIVLPKTALKNTSKGLQATFSDSIKGEDKLFYSQAERNLAYNNSYSSRIVGNKINIAHYFNIMNSSTKTFEDVYLNFFLSQTNVAADRMRPMMAKSAMMETMDVASMAPAMPEPTFEKENIQDLKTISLKNPVTIYPNLNKIKQSEKTYDLEQYAKVDLEKNHSIYLGKINKDEKNTIMVKGSKLNNLLIEKVIELRRNLISNNLSVNNILDIKVPSVDVLPSGKFDVYDNIKGNDKLVVSTMISHTEGSTLEVVKSRNNELKLRDVVFNNKLGDEILVNSQVEVLIKSVVIENMGEQPYVVNMFGKKTVVKPKSKITITS